MKKKPKQQMYKKIPILDIIVAIISLIAFAALIFVVRYYNDKSRMEQEQLAETGSIYQGTKSDGSIYELLELLTINEVNQAGWLELYNKDRNAGIELSSCYISVNGKKKYTFPEGSVIKAGEYLCIEELGSLGTTGHDIIGLLDENGNNLKNILLPRMEIEESYGCRADGDISYSLLSTSKGKSNSESNIIKKDKLAFSVPGGFYDESFRLEITAAEGMTIYYTLDGSEPTNKSIIYKEPIVIDNKSGSNMQYAISEGIDYLKSYQPSSISMGMVVRAIAVDRNGMSSEIENQSYFVGIKKASDIRNIPVLSIITSPDNLFDYFDGIYVSGRTHEDALARGEDGGWSANYLNGWEKEVYVEYFESEKDKTYEGNMSISIILDSNVKHPQKSLQFTALGGAYAGSSLINYYNNNSKRLVVQTNNKDNNYKIREYLAEKLLEDTSVCTADIKPCIVFINGEYWGGYMLRAEYDETFLKNHYNVEEENVLIAQNGIIMNKSGYQQEFKDLYTFITENNLKEDENYSWVKAHMDVQSYIEYFCANMYLANADYGQDNLVMWRTINDQGRGYEDGRWRFLMPRLDNTMKNGESGKATTSSINTFLQSGVSEDMFLHSLLKNEEFCNSLMKVMTEMSDNIFTNDQVTASMSEISLQLKKMAVMSYKRFIGIQGDTFYEKEVDNIESFFEQRRKYILVYTEEVVSRGGISNVTDNAVSE